MLRPVALAYEAEPGEQVGRVEVRAARHNGEPVRLELGGYLEAPSVSTGIAEAPKTQVHLNYEPEAGTDIQRRVFHVELVFVFELQRRVVRLGVLQPQRRPVAALHLPVAKDLAVQRV